MRAGDDRAFEQLYERYRRRIAAYIYGMVKDYGRAEEIAQDVFVSALRRLRSTDAPIAFKPWVYEIAKNACIDQFRRGRRAELVSYDADGGLGESDRGRLAATTPGPDAAVDQKQSLDHLRGAFGGLSESHHEILVMRELEGMSYREIGERLGMSRASVESTLFRARKRLTEEYDELVSGERCLRVQAIVSASADGSLGARDQRRMARHLSCCQPCRRHAALAGLDVAALTAKPALRARIAAVLPLPAFLRRRWEVPDGSRDAVTSSPNTTSLAQWSSHVAGAMDPAGMANWAKAAVAAVTVAIAGVGANVASEKLRTDPAPDSRQPAVTGQAEQRTSGSAATTAAGGSAALGDAPAPATAGDVSSAPDAAAPERGTQVPSQGGGQSGVGGPTSQSGRPNLSRPSAGGPGAPAAPSTPRPSLGDTTSALLQPPPLLSGRDTGESREESRGPIGSTVEDARSGALGALGFGQAPEASVSEPAMPSLSSPSTLSGALGGDGAESRTVGDGAAGSVYDAVTQTVGSLVAP